MSAFAGYALGLLAMAPSWPDDWDGVGFVESVSAFDLASFRPHPPGYPVYVALLRLAAAVVHQPLRACAVVAALSGGGALALVWDATRRAAGESTAWSVAALVGALPIFWRAGSAVGSEAPALACASACAWGIVVSAQSAPRTGAVAIGLGVGLGLGVRLSWGPLYLAGLVLAPRAERRLTAGTAGLACIAWAVPLLAVAGARSWVSAMVAHLVGHATVWGGTVVTEPGPIRGAWLARDVFVDGFGVGRDALGLAIALLLACAVVPFFQAARGLRRRGWFVVAVVVVPYLLWICVGQNLRDQPRHVVPLTALLAAGLGLAARLKRVTAIPPLLALAMGGRSALDAEARRGIPPPGQQLVDLARAQPDPHRLLVFGGASVRFFETTELASAARVAGSLGDVRMELTRVDELPTRVWVTSEVLGAAGRRAGFARVATLCRPPRIDRRMQCLDVDAWSLPFLPRP